MPLNKYKDLNLAITYGKLRLGSKEANLRAMEKMFDDTVAGCKQKDGIPPDMLVFSEFHYNRGNKQNEQFEDTDGPLTHAMAKKARQYNCWAIFNYLENRLADKKRYNTNKMMNRDGIIVASYDKTFLPPDDIRFGNTAGAKDETNVRPIQTEFGPIGMLICYDVQEDLGDRPYELICLLKERGARLVIVSSIGDYTPDTLKGGIQNKIWTAHCGQDSYREEKYFVSNIADPEGNFVAGVANSSQVEPTYTSALINLAASL